MPSSAFDPSILRAPSRWPWPLPALATWLAAALLMAALRAFGLPAPLAFTAATALCLASALRWPLEGVRRRLIVGAGFPLAMLGQAMASGVPGWAWLLPALLMLLAYPLRAWRDAPLFPTPRAALAGAAGALQLPPAPRLLDAGCGIGHGLAALRAQWPDARLDGIEWSWPLAALAALRCPDARVRRGDMWAASWAGYDMVYLFQRPESMPRAWAKACREMAPGSWLASLDFEVSGVRPQAVIRHEGLPALWLYRTVAADDVTPALARRARGGRRAAARGAQPAAAPADNPRTTAAVSVGA